VRPAVQGPGCRALLVNGGGGTGKTAIAGAIGQILTDACNPTAVVDLDALSQFGPTPPGQPGFHDRLRFQNLSALWGTFRAAGARFIVVAGVVEHAALRKSYADCLAGCDVQMVRLITSAENVQERTRTGDRGPRWNLQGAIEQQAELERARVEDFVLANDRPLPEVAREILARAGWPV
jgi:chloramphenicol 3-O-phosphotransferase